VGAVWFDYDADGDLDLYVANQDGDANGLFRNNAGRFLDVAESAGAAWGGRTPGLASNGTVRPCAGDFNNDGRLDLFLANYGPNGLLLNGGGGRFEDVSSAWGIATDGRHDTCALGDFDNDGRLDVYVNGTVTGGVSYRDFLYRNAGTRFEDATPPNVLALHASHGAQWADFDGDGDLDLAVAGTRPDATHALLSNRLDDGARQRSLSVSVIDERGSARRTGAELRVYERGTSKVLATRMIDTGSGYNSQNILPAHFGLAGLDTVDLEVAYITARGRTMARFNNIAPGREEDRRLEIQAPSTGAAKLARVPRPRT
jgi:VCBS repeat protein/ASPIC/UnbV protein